MGKKKTEVGNVLSKAEIFYIEQNPNGASPEKLAEELNVDVNEVHKFYKVAGFDLQHRRAKNGDSMVTIMDPSASQQLDATRNVRTSRIGEISKNCIHRCRKKG